MTGKKISNFRILDLLGKGGMGSVYKAFDLKLERFVAIKFLSEALSKKTELVNRFRNEARNQAKLNHPNIISVYGYEEESNFFAIIMEYFSGFSLEELIRQKEKLSLIESLTIVKQILYGISFAHKNGLLHRDIKPSNVLIDRNGNVKMMDFGISSSLYINEPNSINHSGTLLYLSPEQIEGKPVSERSDIYSIGFTFYEMLTGKPLHNVNNNFELVNEKLNNSIRNNVLSDANIPGSVRAIISKAIFINPQKRFSSCDDFLSELSKIMVKELSDKKRYGKSLLEKIFPALSED